MYRTRLTRTALPRRWTVTQTEIFLRTILGWHRVSVTSLLRGGTQTRTIRLPRRRRTQCPRVDLSTCTRRQCSASTSFGNPMPLSVGSRMLSDQVAQLDHPRLPASSVALFAAAQRTVWPPIPLTGTWALLPAYH